MYCSIQTIYVTLACVYFSKQRPPLIAPLWTWPCVCVYVPVQLQRQLPILTGMFYS